MSDSCRTTPQPRKRSSIQARVGVPITMLRPTGMEAITLPEMSRAHAGPPRLAWARKLDRKGALCTAEGSHGNARPRAYLCGCSNYRRACARSADRPEDQWLG